ncbi:hypothetical protein P171DRAFT_487356 [Karstenula rhodostoma CBS 690.94]|uniref:F-box domain-containing protein n=1 Tax=Karstenula rhodostoma CBS 690.94 TaxID=1392251 RepID=A0A9P4U8A7_9PLEO|nr:hypothetical protein P171DRAFT_487356 [Karstenula rhodostoma CBS 690.94]
MTLPGTVDQDQSRFLRLPAELRVTIYEYTLSDLQYSLPTQGRADYHRMHALPLACRRLYNETHLLIYRYGIMNLRYPTEMGSLIRNRRDVEKAITILSLSFNLILKQWRLALRDLDGVDKVMVTGVLGPELPDALAEDGWTMEGWVRKGVFYCFGREDIEVGFDYY